MNVKLRSEITNKQEFKNLIELRFLMIRCNKNNFIRIQNILTILNLIKEISFLS